MSKLIKLLIVIAILLLIILFIMVKMLSKEEITNNINEKYKEENWIYKGQEAVKYKLKDSSSAKFRNVFFNNNNVPVSCGEVNSKNSFGAYNGYQRFISGGSFENTFLEEEIKDDINKIWNELCIKSNTKFKDNSIEESVKESVIFVSDTNDNDTAEYFILEKKLKVDNNENLRSIVTERVASTGKTYSKRLYDCKNNTVKYLEEGKSLDKMDKSKKAKINHILKGSADSEISLLICK